MTQYYSLGAVPFLSDDKIGISAIDVGAVVCSYLPCGEYVVGAGSANEELSLLPTKASESLGCYKLPGEAAVTSGPWEFFT